MFDILLNAAKLALSEDGRKSVSAIVDFIKRSPEWQKNICVLEAKIEQSHQEHAALLAGLTATKLESMGYTGEGIHAFQTAYMELVRNAFEHGCSSGQAIRVTIEVSHVYVSVTVENAREHRFEAALELALRQTALSGDPKSSRGRGLVLASDLADDFQPVAPRGVKAVFYKDRVVVESSHFSERALITVRVDGGKYNPSLNRRVNAALSKALKEADTILDISAFRESLTLATGDVIALDIVAKGIGRGLVVMIDSGAMNTAAFLRDAGLLIATSWPEALKKLEERV
ncbi:ATP-binding protein [Terracidiphilus gabretensis]|uniref:ATP-binding protein n=1 Tax=Terracidiphilus gabretensis TaxID=1577687 RepID=UPI00071C0631|nr:ATP-binding protein [Terracidiphilus gabretensis]